MSRAGEREEGSDDFENTNVGSPPLRQTIREPDQQALRGPAPGLRHPDVPGAEVGPDVPDADQRASTGRRLRLRADVWIGRRLGEGGVRRGRVFAPHAWP